MTKLNWRNIRNNSIGTVGIVGFAGSLLGIAFLAVDSSNGQTNISQAVESVQTLTPAPGRDVRLVDFNTVQVTQGVMTQTFTFALERVITTANYGNNQQFNEDTGFSTYNDKPAIERARGEGCLLAVQQKSAMENYDFGIRASNRESEIHKHYLETAALFLKNNCPGSP